VYKLLVVDDEAIERKAIKFIVKNSELRISEIMEAANGHEAVAIAETFNPDIVTMDIMMPGLNGIEAGLVLKERKPDVKIVFVTAYDSFEYAHEAIKIGVEEFIIKPASNEKTLEILQSCTNQLDEELQKKLQKESLEVKMHQITSYLENEFVNSVVNGEIDEHQATDYLKFMLNSFNKFIEGFSVVVNIDFSDSSLSNPIYINMVKKKFTYQLSSNLDKNMKFMMNQLRNTIYILIFGYSPDYRNHCKRLVGDEIQLAGEDLNEQLSVKLYYGLGDHYSQISQMWKSFAQAKVAARDMQLSIKDNAPDDISSKNSLQITENELWLSIMNENEEAVFQKADHIMDNIIFASSDTNEAKLKLYEFFILLSMYLNKESQLKHMVPDDVFNDLKTIETRGAARKYIYGYLFEILEELKKQRSNKTPDTLDKAIQFIHSNYGENLTLNDVAYKVGFSTYYFSKLFKKTFGTTFTNYLTQYRIIQAKELLLDPHLTVKSITYQVGFMDPNYFTRVFKKIVGVTPTEYRIRFWQPKQHD
jgi:two-component system response regulator YesN